MNRKLSSFDHFLNKTILVILLIVFGIFSIVGYKLNIVLGTIMITFFVIILSVFLGVEEIKKWIDTNINNRKW
jgi:hypothetical protein